MCCLSPPQSSRRRRLCFVKKRSRSMRHRKMSGFALALMLYAGMPAAAQVGTAFTYQAEIKIAGVPLNGNCDLRFRLFDDAAPPEPPGAQVGPTLDFLGVATTDGRVT